MPEQETYAQPEVSCFVNRPTIAMKLQVESHLHHSLIPINLSITVLQRISTKLNLCPYALNQISAGKFVKFFAVRK